MLKKIVFFLTLLFIPFIIEAKEQINVNLFYSETCIHCQNELKFLDEIKDQYDININKYEAVENKDNSELMTKVKDKLKIKSPYVPFTVIGSKAYIGFSDTIKELILEDIENYHDKERRDVVGEVLGDVPVNDKLPLDGLMIDNDSLNIPLLGNVDPKKISIPLLAMVIGIVDGFNPCAMWVLVFLITMLIGMKNKKRMWILGLSFLITSALIYLLFMMAWLQITVELTSIFFVRIIIGLVALIGGIINIKSYFKSKDGCTVVDKQKRTKIFDKIKKFTTEKSFILALLGVITLACSVNLIELACSAGLPLIFTQILAINDITGISALGYTSIYILFFLLDDLIVFFIAMFTLNISGISTKFTKYSHLIGGIIMVLIAILLVFKPEWLMLNFS